MPSRQAARARHAERFVQVLQELSGAGEVPAGIQGERLLELEEVWMQIAHARDWALEHAPGDPVAKRMVTEFENAGVAVAQIQAETRFALWRLHDSLLNSVGDLPQASEAQEH